MGRTPEPLDPAREEDLLVTAARHFAATAYNGTSLNKVIAEAGWGKSSFYHYFSNKRQLHDHVVRTLTARLTDNVRVPEPENLSGADFWPAMAELLDGLVRAAKRHPETSYLGEMFHGSTSSDDGCLRELRSQVERWLRRALLHGRRVGAIRDDIPEQLLIELTLTVLQTLDRWAVRHKLPAAGGPGDQTLLLRLVRDLIDRR